MLKFYLKIYKHLQNHTEAREGTLVSSLLSGAEQLLHSRDETHAIYQNTTHKYTLE